MRQLRISRFSKLLEKCRASCARIDHMGLLWLLDGSTIVGMRDHAIIETLRGAR
jgi:hypothetical protein